MTLLEQMAIFSYWSCWILLHAGWNKLVFSLAVCMPYWVPDAFAHLFFCFNGGHQNLLRAVDDMYCQWWSMGLRRESLFWPFSIHIFNSLVFSSMIATASLIGRDSFMIIEAVIIMSEIDSAVNWSIFFVFLPMLIMRIWFNITSCSVFIRLSDNDFDIEVGVESFSFSSWLIMLRIKVAFIHFNQSVNIHSPSSHCSIFLHVDAPSSVDSWMVSPFSR